MATNFFNTGKDCTVVLRHQLAPGGQLQLDLITDFDAKPMFHDISSNALDGYTRTRHIPQNLVITFTVDRNNSAIDDFCSALWQAYRVSGVIPDGSVYQYVLEENGSTTTTQYTGVAFKPDDLGSYKKEDRVPQKVTATAMDYRRV